MENLENNALMENSLMSNRQINKYLLETSKWGNFLAIIGYVMMGLLVLLAVFMMFGLSALMKTAGAGFPMVLVGLIYLVLAGVYYFPVTYLYKFSGQIKQAILSKDENLYTSGFENLKSLFKFMGIFMIVMLSLYGVGLLIALPMMMFFK